MGFLDDVIMSSALRSGPGDWFSDRWAQDDDALRRRRIPKELQPELAPSPLTKPSTNEVDYSTGFPIEAPDRPSGTERMDADLERFKQQHPVPPAAMPGMDAQRPVPGLLGPQIASIGTMPPGVGGNPAASPAQPPALPAPTEVPPPPGAAPAPPQGAAGTPPIMAAGGDQSPTDFSAQSRQPIPGVEPGSPGLLGRIDQMTQRNPALLLSLAAGFAGAPSFGTGMSRAFGNAANALPVDQKMQLEQGRVASTYRALIKAGLDPQTALAAAMNPAILQQVAPDYLGTRKGEIKTIKSKDFLGNETEKLVSINPYTNEVTELRGQGGAGGGQGTSLGGGKSMFANGITQENFNHNAVGDDYLKQFDPEVQQAVKDYLAGRTQQTGRQTNQQAIKIIAQKYGNDIGMPADDALIGQRKVWSNSLGDVSKGVGLQAKGFQQGLHHMAQMSDKMVKLGNVTGVTGLEGEAATENWIKNLTSKNKDTIAGIQSDAQYLSGEVGKLFSGNNGGGVRERHETSERFGDPNMSGPKAAGALEATLEAMQGGLQPLEQRRDQLFPNGDAPRGSEFVGPEERRLIEKIRKNIAILRGEQQPAAAPAGARASTGVQWRVVQP